MTPPAEAPAQAPSRTFRFDPTSYPESTTNRFIFTDRELIGYFAGNVTWKYEYQKMVVKVYADALVLHARLSDAAAADAKKEPSESERKEGGAAALLDLGRWKDLSIYAENVRIEVADRHTELEAESLYYEHTKSEGIAKNVRLKTLAGVAEEARRVSSEKSWKQGLEATDRPPEKSPYEKTPLSIHARTLRFRDFQLFDGEGIEISDCDFAVPHMGLSAQSASVRPIAGEGEPTASRSAAPSAPGAPSHAPAGTAARAQGAASRPRAAGDDEALEPGYLIDPEGTWLDLEGHSLLPLPLAYWDTRWQTQLPIRELDTGHSGQFGYFAEVNWNLNYFLSLLPLSNFVPVDLRSGAKLGMETDYFDKRGLGLGPDAVYGKRPRSWDPWQLLTREWVYHGDAQYYFIEDHGDEDRSTREPVPQEERFWGHIWHRQSVPYLGLFDLEYSHLSDSAFLGEYFEREFKEEKEQETLIYWRRNFTDNAALTGLASVQTNDFQPTTEKRPEGKAFLFEQPIFETGLYTDLNLQAAYLRQVEDEALGISPRGFDRTDVYNEWAYPIHFFSPWVEARPFSILRYSDFGEVLDPLEGSEDRATFGAGVAVSQHWARIFPLEKDSIASWLFGASAVKHDFSPKVTYLNIFSNDLPSADLIPIDATENVDLNESISFSLRNELFAKKPVPGKQPTRVRPVLGNRDVELETVPIETRRLVDSEISFALFPRPARDNNGDRSSLLIADNTVAVTSKLSLRGWFELNPNRDFRAERIDASATYDVVPGALSVTAGDRYTRTLSNVGYFFFRWTLSEKWIADAYYSRDFENQRDLEYSFGLTRVFHRLALTLEYSQDVGEDRNSTFSVNVSPVELLKPSRHGYRR